MSLHYNQILFFLFLSYFLIFIVHIQSDSYLSAQMECFPLHLEKTLINTSGMYLVRLVANANSLIFYSLEPFVWILQVSNRLHWGITKMF